MTMTQIPGTTSGSAEPTIAPKQVYRVNINAPIQEVWDALTKQGEPLPFFFGSVLHTTGLRPGAPIRMRTPNNKYTGVVGDVLEFDPPHKFSHTFQFTHLDDPPSTVIYELKEVPGGTEFTLTTENVPQGTKSEKQMAQGGPLIVKTLKSVVETGKPHLGAKVILAMIKLFSFTTPKRCRTENWPMT